MENNRWIEAGLANPFFVEEIYEKYLSNPNDVEASWYFSFSGQAPTKKLTQGMEAPSDELRIYNLIEAYRFYGHLKAKINPISIKEPSEPEELKLENLGFSSADLTTSFPTCGLMNQETAPLQSILETLQSIYCNRIGIEYMGLGNPQLEQWIQGQIEPSRFTRSLTNEQKLMIMDQLNRSELLEAFIHTKYTGQKRFSIEGGETLIPMIEAIIENGSSHDAVEFIIGMAHRGRLNVLNNIMKKTHAEIFSEFEDTYELTFEGSGDVKYHKGFFAEVNLPNDKRVKITLPPNPSHLEAVDAVVEGQVRAKQVQRNGDHPQDAVIPLLIHGDAAIAGQGIVYETMQFCQIPGYANGGTLHIVINNQIGFTATPKESRSTFYCTDIARAFSAPVFHVNAEDPEGCVYVANLAIEIRQQFHCDVFIDLNCYRKYGHNESDEPAYTQPIEYLLIRKKKPIRELYRDFLISNGILEEKISSMEKEYNKNLQEALNEAKTPKKSKKGKEEHAEKDTSTAIKKVNKETLIEIAERISKIPEGFSIHQKLAHLIQERLSMVKGESKPIDWGMAELLAYGSILWDGINVRLSGQDCKRGTFSHRHAVWMDQIIEKAYVPLNHLKENQGRFDVLNSPLSEYAVVGFEFGYSVAFPDSLVIWEAQFGDFSNGAQIIIDQFIATAEQKWDQKFSLVLYLPHGYEGQGPEHSSGRMERFLSLSGEDNMRITNPTTPAQLFHLLRRQVFSKVKKPLIIFTPKGLLRHPQCTSRVSDLTDGTFQEVIDDPISPKTASRLIFCSGRIYYDLISERAKAKDEEIAIIRIEQLYPFHQKGIQEIIHRYSKVADYFWVQEEPYNMGAWDFIHPLLNPLLPENSKLRYVGRSRSASPAVGSHALHKKQYEEIMNTLFKKD